MINGRPFDPVCERCPRLVAHLKEVRGQYPDYHAAPVPCFGPQSARLLIVGLAPGLHGANRSGRPFTGDASGELLFRVLFDTGFSTRASASESTAPPLRLRNCRVTNIVRCLPPGNRPDTSEISNCADYLAHELATLWQPSVRAPRVVVALGGIAHGALVSQRQLRPRPRFAHGEVHELDRRLWLIDSYHPSRLNVNTGRVTEQMLKDVFEHAREILDGRAELDAKRPPA